MNSDSKIEKMLNAVLNGLTGFRQEFLTFKTEVTQSFNKMDKKIDNNHKELTQRLDKFGNQLAYLEDDAPTREEFDRLEKKVDKHISSHAQGAN